MKSGVEIHTFGSRISNTPRQRRQKDRKKQSINKKAGRKNPQVILGISNFDESGTVQYRSFNASTVTTNKATSIPVLFMRLRFFELAMPPIRIGYVPEHYLLPLHLAKPHFPFEFELIPFPSGTGHMVTSLRSGSIDIAIGLTEGWVAGLLTAQGQKERGYTIIGKWVENPLRWAIVTGRNRSEINTVSDLEQHRRVGISRPGSGSHVMAFVLAQQEGWLTQATTSSSEDLTAVPLGPFADLRDGVTGKNGSLPEADFFMWEHFTTKPFFHGESTPLKNIGEIYTPWPSWHITASSITFPDPEQDERIDQLFKALDKGIQEFNTSPDEGIRMLGTGELGCHYTEEDAREWLKAVKFFQTTRGVQLSVMEGVVKVLQTAGVIDSSTQISEGDGVVGIKSAK